MADVTVERLGSKWTVLADGEPSRVFSGNPMGKRQAERAAGILRTLEEEQEAKLALVKKKEQAKQKLKAMFTTKKGRKDAKKSK